MKLKTKSKLITAAAALLIAALIVCDSRYNLQTTRYSISSGKLPLQFDGFRIVHLSDLHGMEFGEDNERLIACVAEQKPDIIALTGDMAENPRQMAVVEGLLKGICSIAPVYYVSGNHEWAGGCAEEMEQLMKKYGVHCLKNSYELIEKGDGRLVIAGVDDPNGRADMIKPDELARQLRSEYPEEYVIWLGHRNYWVEQYPELPVDLILSGHAHGGIVRLPFLGGLLSTKHKLGAEYEMGLYYSGEYCMEVSRGLGNSISVPRFLNRPEVVTIVLGSEKQA